MMCRPFLRSTLLAAVVVGAAALTSALPSGASAQFTHRAVPAGEVTGLDMGIEGSLDAFPGGQVRWFVTLYEVLRRRDLRPAAGAMLEVTASHDAGGVVATASTDENGQAELVVPMPDAFEDGGEAPQLRVVASFNQVRRVFAVQLSRADRYDASLFLDRARVAPGSTVTAFGRLVDSVTGRPAVGVPLQLEADRNDVPVQTEDLVTGRGGTFSVPLTFESEGRVRIRVDGDEISGATRWVDLEEDELSTMWVDVETSPESAPVGGQVDVRVRVRDRMGRALSGARVGSSSLEEPIRTDAEGRAQFPWVLSATDNGSTLVRVTHAAWGVAGQRVQVRVERAPFAVAVDASGGALVPELEGRVYLRLTGPDGEPLSDVDARVHAPRMGAEQTLRAGRDGVVILSGVVGSAARDERGCGGPASMPVRVTVAEHEQSVCVSVDPDATVALEAPSRVEDRVQVRVHRRASVAGRPVEVVALARVRGNWVPLARTTVAAAAERTDLSLPPSAAGVLWLRARPLLEGGRPVRGGGRLVWRGAARAELTLDATGVEAGPGARFAFAMEHNAHDLIRDLRDHDPIGASLALARTDARFEAVLAEHTPTDAGASLVLQEGDVTAIPMPASPIEFGLLRAPWRTRARFVRGRIGRMMRAVERFVEARLPVLDECAVQEGGRWRFNHAILEAALSEAGLVEERATALDGERLDLPGLVAMAPSFTYDHVAARLTRARMLRLIRLLRELVQRQDLDMPWARDGEVDRTLVSLLDFSDIDEHGEFERRYLYDGWGRPFVLRPRRGSPSHPLLGALPGWELLSLGPDGRAGTRDDQRDPFAALLPDGTYADAIGEDLVRTRLRDVALGRASASSLANVMNVRRPVSTEVSAPRRHRHHARRRSPREPTSRPTLRASVGGPVPEAGMPWQGLAPERRAYQAVAVVFSDDGGAMFRETRFETGAPWAAELELPQTMRPGEALRLPVSLVQLAPGPAPELRVAASGGLEASAEGNRVSLRARRPGLSQVSVDVISGGTTVAHFERTVRVVPAGSLRARHAGARIESEGAFRVTIPDDATPWRSRLVVAAPGAIGRDSLFAAQRDRHPALFAWSEALSGAGLDPALSDAVGRQHNAGGLSPLATACALAAYATDEDAPALGRLVQRLNSAVPEGLSERANILAALAAAVPVGPQSAQSPTAALGGTLSSLRQSGWRALAVADEPPASMARLAAALLLVDPEDSAGGELLRRAEARLEPDASGRRWVPGDRTRPGDGWVGTLALSVAARQAGRDGLADSLASGAVARLHLAARAGEEGVFWALAAGLYGALGVGGPEHVEVTLDGVGRRVALQNGVAELPLEGAQEVTVRTSAAVYARTESRYLRPWAASDAGRVELSIEGVSGRLGDTAGFELVVSNPSDEPIAAPLLEVSLPGAAVLGEAAREALGAAPVLSIQGPDGAGVLRLRLATLEAHGTFRIAFPVRWIASGTTEGLGVSCAEASTPWEVSRLAPRRLEIREGTE